MFANGHQFEESKKLVDAGAIAAAKIFETQAAMMEMALRCCQVHVPAEEMTMVTQAGDKHHNTLVVRGMPMYEVTANLTDIDGVSVTGGWINWPPPEPHETVDLTDSLLNALSKRHWVTEQAVTG